ncbi:UNVERIFIED_CONTAM: hypothetical protein NCL1_35994 [Trichonephila clavipes]
MITAIYTLHKGQNLWKRVYQDIWNVLLETMTVAGVVSQCLKRGYKAQESLTFIFRKRNPTLIYLNII